MDEDSSGFSSELVITFDTHAGPAVVHGPQAEPDSPPLTRASVAALEALVALAAADGITARLELPATRDRGWAADSPLPSGWLWAGWGSGVGLVAWDAGFAEFPETAAEEAARVADTAHEALVEWMPGYGRSTNWPPCPEHPTTHPLQLVAGSDVDPRPRWTCPLTGVVVDLPPLGGADPV